MQLDDVQIFIESSLVDLTRVYPTIKGVFTYKKESGKLYFKHESKDKFIFSEAEDYALIKPHFANECEEISLIIKVRCGGELKTYWQGFFKMFDARDDRDKCKIEVKVKPLDAYKCFEQNLETSQNVFTSGEVVTVKAIGGTYETEVCTAINSHAYCDDYYPAYYFPLADCITPSEWCLKENKLTVNGQDIEPDCSSEFDFVLEQETTWHRETVVTDCEAGTPVEPSFGEGWELLEDNCSGDGTATWWRCPTAGGAILGDYTRGRRFKAVVERILANMGCDLTIKSDFFGFNPVGDAPDNVAYEFAQKYCQNITFHQKSDIKQKSVLTPSSSPAWDLTPKDFFDDARKMFNVYPIIVNGVLIWEHYSFFTSVLGLNLTGQKMPKALEYGTAENIKTENYYWPEDTSFEFRAKPIIYDCGEQLKEERCTLLHTDIAHIEDPANADRVGDTGFVLISNGVYEGQLIINNNNDPFKWSNLQENLHKHGRLYKSGKLNDVAQTFLSWQPYIKQDKFKTPLCCTDVFNPSDLITTDLGIASVYEAEENIYTKQLELGLNY